MCPERDCHDRIRYNTTDVTEIPLASLKDRLLSAQDDDAPKITTPDIPYPLIAMVECSDRTTVTVRVDSTRRLYRMHLAGQRQLSLPYYPPPVWMRAALSKANAPMGQGLAVVPESALSWKSTQLYKWPLANVFDDGNICTGSTTLEMAFDRAVGRAEGMQAAIDRFFNSEFNFDLLHAEAIYQEVAAAAFEAAPGKDRCLQRITEMSLSGNPAWVMKLLCVMEEPDGWRHLNWEPLRHITPPERFVRVA